MHFCLVDAVVSVEPPQEPSSGKGAAIITLKHVSNAEEYLQDHFPTFPVLPGVLMLESLVHAARVLCTRDASIGAILGGMGAAGDVTAERLTLSRVRALKYGTFMPPGSTLRVHVTFAGVNPDGSLEFKGEATKLGSAPSPGEDDLTAVSGKFTLRPVLVPRLT